MKYLPVVVPLILMPLAIKTNVAQRLFPKLTLYTTIARCSALQLILGYAEDWLLQNWDNVTEWAGYQVGCNAWWPGLSKRSITIK